MRALQSQSDTPESRLELREGNNSHFQACVATQYGLIAPRSAFQSILLLPHWPTQSSQPKPRTGPHAVLCAEKEEQKVLFHFQHAFCISSDVL